MPCPAYWTSAERRGSSQTCPDCRKCFVELDGRLEEVARTVEDDFLLLKFELKLSFTLYFLL
jgi:hypothetical protein